MADLGTFTDGSTATESMSWNTSSSSTDDSMSALQRFGVAYQSVHGYLSLTVCSFGILSNALNIIVLTRRSMSNATNCLLTALAVTDLLTMVVYVPYAGYFYCLTQPDPAYGHRLAWIVYLLFNSAFSITAHTVAVWLTVSIAVFRYIVVCGRHSLGTRLCNRERARVAIGAIVATTVVFCVPNYIMYRPLALTDPTRPHDANLSTSIPSTTEGERFGKAAAELYRFDLAFDTRTFASSSIEDGGSTTFRQLTDGADSNSDGRSIETFNAEDQEVAFWFEENSFITERYRIINFWFFGVVLKVVPCVLLTALSGLLVRAMRSADQRRRRLLNAGRRAESDRAGERNRTTAMLVAVVLCFVATEMPQGVLAFLSGIDDRVFAAVYVPLGDFWDIMVLANSAVNFIVYCKMNRRFRCTVVECFCRCVGLERFGFAVGLSVQEATTATAGLTLTTPRVTQSQQPTIPLYSITENAQYTRM